MNKIELSKEEIINYLKKLKNKTYKCLPLFEGRDAMTKEITIKKEDAYELYYGYAVRLHSTMVGFYNTHKHNECLKYDIFKEILYNIRGAIELRDLKSIRTVILSTVSLFDKVVGE